MNSKKQKMILEAAERLFGRFGIAKTGVDEIASLARVAKGTIYNHFGSKEGVIRALISQKVAHFEGLLRTSLISMSDPLEKLKLALKDRVRFVTSNPYMAEFLKRDRSDPEDGALFNELEKKGRSMIADILEDAQKKGVVSSLDRDRIASILIKALRGFERDGNGEGESLESRESDLDIFLSIIARGLSGGMLK